MSFIHKVAGYKTSRNYRRLVELMKQSAVVCIVDYDRIADCRDVAHTLFEENTGRGESMFQISARGIAYIHAFYEEDFIKQCQRANCEFIEPNT